MLKLVVLSLGVLVAAAGEDKPPGSTTRELLSEEAATTKEHEAVASNEKVQATERVNELVNGIRRLQYSYDFDSNCVSSFRECIDDSNCDSDEECMFTTSRKKRKLEAAGKEQPSKLRALLFGSNAVGQCVCL